MKKSPKGFTLLEILLVLVVGGILLVGIVNAIFQTTGITVESSTLITALEDIREVAARMSKDIRMAATANLEDGLTLDWTRWYDETGELNPVDHSISYTLPSGGELQRSYDPDTSVGGDEITTTVGSYISDIEFSQEGNIITVTITSSPRGNAETAEQRTYQFYLQPKENLAL